MVGSPAAPSLHQPPVTFTLLFYTATPALELFSEARYGHRTILRQGSAECDDIRFTVTAAESKQTVTEKDRVLLISVQQTAPVVSTHHSTEHSVVRVLTYATNQGSAPLLSAYAGRALTALMASTLWLTGCGRTNGKESFE